MCGWLLDASCEQMVSIFLMASFSKFSAKAVNENQEKMVDKLLCEIYLMKMEDKHLCEKYLVKMEDKHLCEKYLVKMKYLSKKILGENENGRQTLV